jgi:hypothetical protein
MMTTSANQTMKILIGATIAAASLSFFQNGRILLPPVGAFSTVIPQLKSGSCTNSRQLSSVSSSSSSSSSSVVTTSFSLYVTSSSSSSSSAFPDDSNSFAFDDTTMDHHHEHRKTEFINLGSVEESMERQRRIQREERNEQRFVKYGDDLWALRKLINKLSHQLLHAIETGMREEESNIREQLEQIQQQDPEIVYKMEMEKLQLAQREGRHADARRNSRNANNARSCLPQFNLEGLWVGK